MSRDVADSEVEKLVPHNENGESNETPSETTTAENPIRYRRWLCFLLMPLMVLALLSYVDDVYVFGLSTLHLQQPIPTTDHQNNNSTTRDPADFVCTWEPNVDEPCVDRVVQQIRDSIGDGIPLHQRRWVFLGDSTMFRLYGMSALTEYLSYPDKIRSLCPNQYRCFTRHAGRCDTNEVLNLPRPQYWRPPNFTLGEGPMKYGLENHFCQDCSGCDSRFLHCSKPSVDISCNLTHDMPNRGGVYGGYFSLEYARDVEVQTDQYTTTQESFVHYLRTDWNTESIVADFGRPICVASAGHHDIAVPNITLDAYLDNVVWYANLLSTACDHVIWLSNNCPQTDEFVQTKNQTLEWNYAVRDRLIHIPKMSYIDVFNASVNYTHLDNLHMDVSWYRLLGNMFLQVIQRAP